MVGRPRQEKPSSTLSRRPGLDAQRQEIHQESALGRGLLILRAFEIGDPPLGNATLAERTGLAKATVSRLTQTLLELGYLQYRGEIGKYELAPSVLGLCHSYLGQHAGAGGGAAGDARACARRPGQCRSRASRTACAWSMSKVGARRADERPAARGPQRADPSQRHRPRLHRRHDRGAARRIVAAAVPGVVAGRVARDLSKDRRCDGAGSHPRLLSRRRHAQPEHQHAGCSVLLRGVRRDDGLQLRRLVAGANHRKARRGLARS